jgi:hypothetical protein
VCGIAGILEPGRPAQAEQAAAMAAIAKADPISVKEKKSER